MRTYRDAKAMAKAMRAALALKELSLSHSEALEIVAAQFGLDNWNILSAKIGETGDDGPENGIVFERTAPIVRIFDIAKAREYYLDYLGFAVDWEHRYDDNAPLYMQISRGDLKLHLSEHYGDAGPGGNMVVYMRGAAAFQRELSGKDYRYLRPGLNKHEWGLGVTLTDPFGNHMRFMELQDGFSADPDKV